jgi:hypothetical protein
LAKQQLAVAVALAAVLAHLPVMVDLAAALTENIVKDRGWVHLDKAMMAAALRLRDRCKHTDLEVVVLEQQELQVQQSLAKAVMAAMD